MTQSARSGFWYYVCGAALVFAGFGAFAYILIHGVFHIADNLARIIVPGEKDLTLSPGLPYAIFLEQQSAAGSRDFFTLRQQIAALTCSLSSPSGSQVPLRRSSGFTTYQTDTRYGVSILEFTSEETGVYHIACDYPENQRSPEAVLAIGSGVGRGIFHMVFRGLGFMFGGLLLGGGIIALAPRRKKPAAHPIPA